MTQKIFINGLAHSQADVIQQVLDLLQSGNAPYCVIGGLAVNAYVEPVASLDLDIVIAVEAREHLVQAAAASFSVKHFPHRINLESAQSALRIQLQTDPRYQAFIANASLRNVMGYDMMVAAIEEVLQGKVWAYLDDTRRKSKRQKDLADIFRLVEAYPRLQTHLPEAIRKLL
jgi:hypothetical protein